MLWSPRRVETVTSLRRTKRGPPVRDQHMERDAVGTRDVVVETRVEHAPRISEILIAAAVWVLPLCQKEREKKQKGRWFGRCHEGRANAMSMQLQSC